MAFSLHPTLRSLNRRAGFYAVLALAPLLLAACSPEAQWDQEFACHGQEQSVSYFAQDAARAPIHKAYPLSVDFHVRSGTALVKGASVTLETTDADTLHLRSHHGGLWLNGQLDRRTGQLLLVEERTLAITGGTQTIRTTGQFVCQPVVAAASAARQT